MDEALDEWIEFVAAQEQKFKKSETNAEENIQRSLRKTLTIANFNNKAPETFIRRSANRNATIKYNSMLRKGVKGKPMITNAMISNQKMNEVLKEEEENYQENFGNLADKFNNDLEKNHLNPHIPQKKKNLFKIFPLLKAGLSEYIKYFFLK